MKTSKLTGLKGLILSHFKLQSTENNGNDTIDSYPLERGGIKKIFVVSEQRFKEIQKELKLFFKGVIKESGQSKIVKPKDSQRPKFKAKIVR